MALLEAVVANQLTFDQCRRPLVPHLSDGSSSAGHRKRCSLADELAYRAAHLHRLVHRIAEHFVDGEDREPRSLALVEALRARHGLKHDDTKPRTAELLNRVTIEKSVRAPDLHIERAFVLKAPRSADH